jgi:hypothetical protein
LYALANKGLADADGVANMEDGVSLTAIASAVDAINNAFDECRVLIGFNIAPCDTYNADYDLSLARKMNTTSSVSSPVSDIKVAAFPNPFTDAVKFTITSPVSGQAQLEVFNMMGQKVSTLFTGHIQANRQQVVEHRFSTQAQQNLIFVLRVGDQQVTGKLLNISRN